MGILEVEDEPVSVDGVQRRCAVQWRPSVERSDGRRWASRRRQRPLSIGLGLGTVGSGTSYLWHYTTAAHQPSVGLGSPDQGAVNGPIGLWANRWRSN
jgi:hypothetical protein